MEDKITKVSIVVSKGSLDGVYPGLIMANGGKVFTEEEARRSLVAEAGRVSRRTVQERVSRRDVLLLLALLAFLAEIVYRKLSEMRRRGRSGA